MFFLLCDCSILSYLIPYHTQFLYFQFFTLVSFLPFFLSSFFEAGSHSVAHFFELKNLAWSGLTLKATLLPYSLSAVVRHESSCSVSFAFGLLKPLNSLCLLLYFAIPSILYLAISSSVILSVTIMNFDVTIFSPYAFYLEDSPLGLVLSFLVIGFQGRRF